jgi:hypothetical protein
MRFVFVGLFATLASCSQSKSVDDDGDGVDRTGSQSQAIVVDEGELSSADDVAPSPTFGFHRDPVPRELAQPAIPPNAPRSTEEKLMDPSWPEQLAAKEARKAGLISILWTLPICRCYTRS